MRATTLTYLPLPAPAFGKTLRHARNIALFAAAPFVALAYVVAFPLVGLGALAWMAYRAVRAPAA